MDRSTEATKREILARGTDDWVHAGEIIFSAAQAMFEDHRLDGYPDDQTLTVAELAALRKSWLASQEREAFPLAIRAVKELIRDGLVQIGYTTNTGFVPWEGSLEEIEQRIDAVAATAEFPLLPGHLFWLNSTPEGDAVANAAGGFSSA